VPIVDAGHGFCAWPSFLTTSDSFGQAAAPEPSHPVFDLYANRTLAHIEARGGLLLLGGSAGFARYVHFGRPTPSLAAACGGRWQARHSARNRCQAASSAAPRPSQNQAVYLSLKSPTKSSLKISVGGKSSVAVPLAEGWQLVTVPLPADSLRAGENTLSLTFAQSGTFALGGGSAFPQSGSGRGVGAGGRTAAPPAARSASRSSPMASRLLIPAGGALHYYAFVPKGGALACQRRRAVPVPSR
jgi:hypothetical protein